MSDGKGIDQPNAMKLVIDFSGLGAFRNEVSNLLYLGFVSSLEAWRVVEDKLGVADEDKWAIDVVDSALTKVENGECKLNRRADRIITSAVGSICYWE